MRLTGDPKIDVALRELYGFMEQYTLRNIDFHKRRIVNASPSVDLYDYVVRKELPELVAQQIQNQTTRQSSPVTAANYDKVTFGIGVGTPVVAGDYVTPPYVWSNSRQGRPAYGAVLANVPPTGTDLHFDIKKNDVSLLNTSFATFPAGTAARQVVLFSGDLASTIISRGDVITPHVSQIGSIVPGQDITIVIFCSLL